MRLRITFAKTEAMRYTGHLDLQRTWERTLRRAALPLAYSQGYSPHARIQLAAALPLGFTSQHEVVDVWLETVVELGDTKVALQRAVPPGIRILELEEIDPRSPPLQTRVLSAEYRVTLLESCPELDTRLQALLAAESLPRERRGKSYDLRPLIEELQSLPPDEEGRLRLHLRLMAQEGRTGRPEEVLAALDVPIQAARITRTRLIFES